MILVLFCLLLGQGALSNEHRINNSNELIQFSKNVSSGTSYKGTTVFLDADIEFSGGLSEQFEPIGTSNKYFQGTFDGQGYAISNLAMNSSSSQYVGLFGYSSEATIRNVVLDSSCSVVSSYSDPNHAYVGGIIGYSSKPNNLDYSIDSCVNLGSVIFAGNQSGFMHIGGIVGYLSSNANIRNCANYGSVTHSGTVSSNAHIGGIVGESYGSSSNKVIIQNCLNYGTINHSGTTKYYLFIGGILGYSYGINNIENCVSGGKISSNKQAKYSNIGSIAGFDSSSKTTITHCYWTSDVGNYSAYGYNQSAVSIDTETKLVSLKATTIDNLNNYNSSWDKWFMLHLNGGSINNLSQTSLVVTQKHFPDPVKAGTNNAFLFWCLDTECNEKYDPKTTDITNVTGLYAVWNISTVTFDFGNGTTSSKSVVYGQKYGELLSVTRTGYTFAGWFTEREAGKGENVTEDDSVTKGFNHTLYAHWTANNYTIAFDFGNGTVVNETLKYNETIIYPDNLTREECVFSGWKPKPKTMPANDTTVVAQWIENATSEVIKIVFSKKDMTIDEVTEIIKGFTKENFTIKEFEVNKNNLIVIIRFDDVTSAKNFVEAIAVNDNDLFIESISFLSEPLQDMVTSLQLPSVFGLFFLFFLFDLALF